MNRKHLGFLFLGLIIGTIFGYLIAYVVPRKTIFDRLKEDNVHFSAKSWYAVDLQRVQYLDQLKYFEYVARTYEEKQDPLFSEPTDVVDAFIDSDWNVVWIEVRKAGTDEIKYVGFHFYCEPD